MNQELVGTVLSDKMTKTRIIQVERLVRQARYKKVLKVRKKFYAHDEQNRSKVGDQVKIQKTRPLSRTKRWKVVELLTQKGS